MIAEQLKKSILQAAIQGKLTEQLPEDGDARDLLKEIHKEKQRLIREGKIKKDMPLPEISDDEIPFDIPANWCWVRLGIALSVIGGTSYNKDDVRSEGIRIIRGGNIIDGEFALKLMDDDVYVDPKLIDEGKRPIKGDIIIVASTGSKKAIGKPAFIDESLKDTLIGAFLRIIRPSAVQLNSYIRTIFRSSYYRESISNIVQGTNINNLKAEHITNLLMPLPPLSEQHRIVERLEEVLPVIDKLARDETKIDELLNSFPKKMKDAILQAAIQGKLTEQLPEDGDARDLLKDIQKEKQRLIKEGKIKKEKPLPEITEDEIPFDIPANWCWVRLDSVCQYIHRGKTPKYSAIRKYPVIAQKCNQWDGFHIEKAQFIDPDTVSKYSEEQFLETRDLLWNSTGLGTLGRVVIYEGIKNPYGFAVADSHVTIIRTLKDQIMPEFMHAILSGPWIQSIVEDISTGSTKQKELATETIRNVLVPVPPLFEQRRIVERLNQLLLLCDAIEQPDNH